MQQVVRGVPPAIATLGGGGGGEVMAMGQICMNSDSRDKIDCTTLKTPTSWCCRFFTELGGKIYIQVGYQVEKQCYDGCGNYQAVSNNCSAITELTQLS